MRGKFYKRTDISAVKRLFLGAGMAMAALLLFSAIFSGISMLTDDAAAKIPLFAILTLVVSAAVSGAVSTRTVSDGRLSLALLSALLAALNSPALSKMKTKRKKYKFHGRQVRNIIKSSFVLSL